MLLLFFKAHNQHKKNMRSLHDVNNFDFIFFGDFLVIKNKRKKEEEKNA